MRTIKIYDWVDAVVDWEDGWINGLPYKPFLNPNSELRKLLGPDFSAKVLVERNCNGYSDIEITAAENICNIFEGFFGDVEIEDIDLWAKIVDCCDKWINENPNEFGY